MASMTELGRQADVVAMCVVLVRFIPVLMLQAKVLWERGDYRELEMLFSRSVDYCRDNDTWRLNVAHVLYMQNKFEDAVSFYEPLVNNSYDNVRTHRPHTLTLRT